MALIQAEAIEQIKVCHWLKSKTNLRFYHFVNEGKRSYANASLLKRMGMKAGVADLFLPESCGSFKGLWLELKSSSGKLSPAQSEFLEEMTKLGYLAICCWGSDSAIKFIKQAYGIE